MIVVNSDIHFQISDDRKPVKLAENMEEMVFFVVYFCHNRFYDINIDFSWTATVQYIFVYAGVSRTLPFAQLNEDVMNQINELYKAAHHPKMNTVLRAFSILFQVSVRCMVAFVRIIAEEILQCKLSRSSCRLFER